MGEVSDDKIISYIRLIGKEFDSIISGELELWIEFVKPMVSKKLFGDLYEQAVAYLVCHNLKMNGAGSAGAFGVPVADMLMGGSVSEGGVSVSFGTNQSMNLQPDAEYALTLYGLKYLDLRRRVIVPIRVRGESGGN